jgi:hypothetical protein
MVAARRQREARSRAVQRGADSIAAIFSRAKAEIATEVMKSLGLMGGANTLTGTYAPTTQAEVLYHLRRVNASAAQALKDIDDKVGPATQRLYLAAVNEARAVAELSSVSTMEQLGDSMLYEPTISLQQSLIKNQATSAILKARTGAGRIINSWSLDPERRRAVQEAVLYGQFRGGGVKTIADEVVKRLNAAGGFPPELANAVGGKWVTINGRNFDLASYGELVAESRMSQLYNDAQRNEYLEDGYALVQVDDHETTSEVCRPFEATVWSITGSAIGNYRPIEEALNGGPPFHPRCSHIIDPVEFSVSGRGRVTVQDAVYGRRDYRETDVVKAAIDRIARRASTVPKVPANVFYQPDKSKVPNAMPERTTETSAFGPSSQMDAITAIGRKE